MSVVRPLVLVDIDHPFLNSLPKKSQGCPGRFDHATVWEHEWHEVHELSALSTLI
jgi:hypothetical protein